MDSQKRWFLKFGPHLQFAALIPPLFSVAWGKKKKKPPEENFCWSVLYFLSTKQMSRRRVALTEGGSMVKTM